MPEQRDIHSNFTALAILSIFCNTIIYLEDYPLLHTFFSLLRLVAVLYAVSLTFINFKIGKFVYPAVLFFAVLGYTTFIHHGALNLWASYFLNTIGLSILVYFSLLRSAQKTIQLLAFVFSLLIYLNLITVILVPGGILKGAYLLGRNYNQIGAMLLCGIVTNCMAYDMHLKSFASTLVLCLVCVFTPLIFGSMTSTAGCLMASAYMFVPIQKVRRLLIVGFFVFYLVFQAFVVFMQQDISTQKSAVYLVEDVMGKDLTFTHRTLVWLMAYDKIQESPLTGYGMRTGEWFSGEFNVLSAHNFILQILIYGGIVLFAAFVLVLAICVFNALKKQSRVTETVLFGLCSFFFMMMMENYNIVLIMYMLMLTYYSPRFSEAMPVWETHPENKTDEGNNPL